MTVEAIINRGEFFSDHYLDRVIGGDIGDLRGHWKEAEDRGEPSARRLLTGAGEAFFAARARVAEATGDTRAEAARALNDVVLATLGYTPARREVELTRNEVEPVHLSVAHETNTDTGRLLVALDAAAVTDVDELFARPGTSDDGEVGGDLLEPLWRERDKTHLTRAPDAIGEIFTTDDPPRFVLVVAGAVVLLADRAKWAEGRFLAVDLDAALERNDTSARGELEMIAALFSADSLVPLNGESTFDELEDRSQRHAVGVSKELRTGIRESIEILANEVIDRRLEAKLGVYDGPNAVDPAELTRQCLRWLYRLLVLLYAESRPGLGVVPADDEAYLAGYSLDRLRELCLVELDTDQARAGTHLHQSLRALFELVNEGYHAQAAVQSLTFEGSAEPGEKVPSTEEYLAFPGLNAALFDAGATPLLENGITLHNQALQAVLALLMLSPESKGAKGAERGFISYAQLGINQLGAVYEGLMAYTGFFAERDLFEVAKGGDPTDGTWVLPADDAADYPDEVFVTRTDPLTGRRERVHHRRGEFVFRLSGRDRQRSASYYTPEVLTRCVVRHSLAELLGTDDYAPEGGSAGITEAAQILDLTICEPALGSGAFLNEAIDQLGQEYLRRRQIELGDTLDAEAHRRELAKVKAHLALHQCYGVDLNATAVELAEVSLWLNCMHPGLKAPWFGLQLRQGNSLVGARRATWRTSQLGDRPWAKTKSGQVMPPVDRGLSEGALDPDEIHHFLLPGHGWAAVADRKEAKELRPEQAKALKDWRKQVLKAPGKRDAKRLEALSRAVEELWALATERIRLTQRALRRQIDVYGSPVRAAGTPITRGEAERILGDAESALGRLRTLMDAWVGLWFWTLDSEVQPPSWDDWLEAAEALVKVDETHAPSGQISFDDLSALLAADEPEPETRSVAELKQRHPWLALALEAARREGAWHWELAYAPVFEQGGFDLQVGNPPWVRLDWEEDVVLAELDPWWGVTERSNAREKRERRSGNLATRDHQASYLFELAAAEGTVEVLGSPCLRPTLAGVRTNLYLLFMDTTWRHLALDGTVGLLHPETHFTDPKAAALRRATYGHLRRHWQFINELMLFEDIHHMVTYGVHVYGQPQAVRFVQASQLFSPETVDSSLVHDATGEVPGIQLPGGGWDLRPHRDRVLTITEEVLADWARLFDEPGTPAAEARLLRPVTTADRAALSVLADQPTRLADHDYRWTSGWNETNAKADGTIRWETERQSTWDDVILQGPHFTVATPFAKEPNENCQHNQDYSEWDLEALPKRVIPRTNYQRACAPEAYTARLPHWNGEPATERWRLLWRAMTQPGSERSLHAAILPPGPAHVGGAFSLALDAQATAVAAGLWSTLPFDYLVKVSGVSNVKEFLVKKFPQQHQPHPFRPLLLRTLRLNCLTVDYAPLWQELYDEAWEEDGWTDPDLNRVGLGDVKPTWTTDTPLRRDYERRLALVELDALAALMLGLTAEQLCAIYRTQFAVLRKYEHRMAFDAEGRKVSGHHQSAGYRQAELQQRAKDGELSKEWKNIWQLYEAHEEDPGSVDWAGHFTPPFTRPNREAEMTRAHFAFQAHWQGLLSPS